MRCTSPKTVGFLDDGKTITWSPKKHSKQYPTFQLPCTKCLSCRLENARETAVRCIHEAQMYQNNAFLTLTYKELPNGINKLDYRHMQLFMKRLRKHIFTNFIKSYGRENWNLLSKSEQREIYGNIKISSFMVGEFGEKTKRVHWHCLIFNWRPSDLQNYYTTDRGDRVFTSRELDELWSYGDCTVGEVTFESAGYCARYAAKKLTHGHDGEHEYEPIAKRSSHSAIGKKWIEKYYKDVFNLGYVVLPTGATCAIPRYYERWLKKTHPDFWKQYVTQSKLKAIKKASEKEAKEKLQEMIVNQNRSGLIGPQKTKNESRKQILEAKFNSLKQYLKI